MILFFAILGLVLGCARLYAKRLEAGSYARFRLYSLPLYGYLISGLLFVPVIFGADVPVHDNTVLQWTMGSWLIGLILTLGIPRLKPS